MPGRISLRFVLVGGLGVSKTFGSCAKEERCCIHLRHQLSPALHHEPCTWKRVHRAHGHSHLLRALGVERSGSRMLTTFWYLGCSACFRKRELQTQSACWNHWWVKLISSALPNGNIRNPNSWNGGFIIFICCFLVAEVAEALRPPEYFISHVWQPGDQVRRRILGQLPAPAKHMLGPVVA